MEEHVRARSWKEDGKRASEAVASALEHYGHLLERYEDLKLHLTGISPGDRVVLVRDVGKLLTKEEHWGWWSYRDVLCEGAEGTAREVTWDDRAHRFRVDVEMVVEFQTQKDGSRLPTPGNRLIFCLDAVDVKCVPPEGKGPR